MSTNPQPAPQTGKPGFPADFVWGAATASYQIEGAVAEDGRGPSIWDTFAATPGKVRNGDSGAVACDHYHRYDEDIALMQQLNLGAYRFSIAWPRVLPQGNGPVNQAGLDFYDRLTEALLQAGIQPYATLYHWDLPQALEDQGGWANRQTAYAFAEYAEAVTRRLGDRIRGYITLNEPWCSAYLGYGTGEHAPGRQDRQAELAATHHLLLAHGLALPVIRRNAPGAEAGITLNLWPTNPATTDPRDAQAAQRSFNLNSRLYLDPLVQGAYHPDVLSSVEAGLSIPVEPGDLAIIQAPLDFLGINYYHRQVIQDHPTRPEGKPVKPQGLYTSMGWEVYPPGIYELLAEVHRSYRLPKYYITENGSSGEEEVSEDGRVHDPLRRYYYQEHLAQCQRLVSEGIPLAGYFAWSLMDNFEWAWGYSRRFGLVHVDYATQARTIKDSGYWYSQVTRANALPEEKFTL